MKLKIYIIAGILVLFHISIKCQKYTEFDFENGIWMCNNSFSNDGDPITSYFEYFCKGDTTINNTNYYKLFAYQKEVQGYPGGGTIYLAYKGAINNFDDKTIRFIETGQTNETTIYNFNLSVGDTIINGYGGESWYSHYREYLIITSIDSIEYCGKYHRRYIYNEWEGAIIEGIGSVYGLLDPLMTIQLDFYTNFDCYTEKSNNNCDQCSLLVSNNYKLRSLKDIKVYIEDWNINIYSENKINEIYIYNILGNMVYKTTDTDNKYMSIQLPKSGGNIFLIKFKMNDQIQTKKIILP